MHSQASRIQEREQQVPYVRIPKDSKIRTTEASGQSNDLSLSLSDFSAALRGSYLPNLTTSSLCLEWLLFRMSCPCTPYLSIDQHGNPEGILVVWDLFSTRGVYYRDHETYMHYRDVV